MTLLRVVMNPQDADGQLLHSLKDWFFPPGRVGTHRRAEMFTASEPLPPPPSMLRLLSLCGEKGVLSACVSTLRSLPLPCVSFLTHFLHMCAGMAVIPSTTDALVSAGIILTAINAVDSHPGGE